MLWSDFRLLFALCYLVLLLWRSLVEGHTPDYWWIVLIVYFLSLQATRAGEALSRWWQLRRVVKLYRLLEPSTRDRALHRLWLASLSYDLGKLVQSEGIADVEGVVERYPFARSAKLTTIALFWTAIALGATLYSLLVLIPTLPGWIAWPAWVVGSTAVLVAGVLRRRLKTLHSTLEISPFAISEVAEDGTRRTLHWTNPLLLRYRRWPERFELSTPGVPTTICLDFNRIAVMRAFRLTLEYGGFQLPSGSEGDAA